MLETFNSSFHTLTPVIEEKGVVRDLLDTCCACMVCQQRDGGGVTYEITGQLTKVSETIGDHQDNYLSLTSARIASGSSERPLILKSNT